MLSCKSQLHTTILHQALFSACQGCSSSYKIHGDKPEMFSGAWKILVMNVRGGCLV